MFTNARRGKFVFITTLMQMSHSIAYIACITQATFKFIYHALLANYGWFWFLILEHVVQFPAHEDGLDGDIYFISQVFQLSSN